MEKILEYRFDHKLKTIFERIKGPITLNDLIAHEKAKLHDPQHNDSYSVYIDLRGAVFEFSDEEKKRMYYFMEKITSEMNMDRKCAFVTDRPLEVANSILFKMEMHKLSPMNFETFSTEEAAYKWLYISKDNLS